MTEHLPQYCANANIACRANNCAVGTGDACDASDPLNHTTLLKGHVMQFGSTLYGQGTPTCKPFAASASSQGAGV